RLSQGDDMISFEIIPEINHYSILEHYFKFIFK
ncbi:alpha/beta hydrolase, partial [Acinetobacter baumannii]|nr:alpha/beta hydrolase [Acinetobacter baumannii]